MVFVVALIVDALAPSFGGTKDRVQALKTVAYCYTASWVAGIAAIVPFISLLIMLAAGIYGIYLLYLGLPHTMKCPQDKAAGYTAVIIIVVIVLSLLIGAVVAAVTGAGRLHARRIAVQCLARLTRHDVRQGQHGRQARAVRQAGRRRRARKWKPRRSPAISRRRPMR